jgi:hypothetical protein
MEVEAKHKPRPRSRRGAVCLAGPEKADPPELGKLGVFTLDLHPLRFIWTLDILLYLLIGEIASMGTV